MNILITGGAGYIGSVLASYLLNKGNRVTVYDRLLYGGESLLSLMGDPKFHLIIGDIRDKTSLKNGIKHTDAVVHLAALVGEDACSVDTKAAKDINTNSTKNLVRMARHQGVARFIFSSTCSNYGITDPKSLADEDSVLTPQSLYAETKIEAEKIVVNAQSKDFSSTVLRLATVCGLSPRMRFNLLVNDLARSAALNRKIYIYAPDAWRPFVHILDVARAIEVCLMSDRSKISGKIFNIVGENYQKRMLCNMLKKHFPNTPMASKPGKIDPRDYKVSAMRISDVLNFTPIHSIEQAFLEVSHAVQHGIFVDPYRPLYEALPMKEILV